MTIVPTGEIAPLIQGKADFLKNAAAAISAVGTQIPCWQVFDQGFTPLAIMDWKYTGFRPAYRMAQILRDRCLPIRRRMVRV